MWRRATKTTTLNSSFCAVPADSNSKWPHGRKAYFCSAYCHSRVSCQRFYGKRAAEKARVTGESIGPFSLCACAARPSPPAWWTRPHWSCGWELLQRPSIIRLSAIETAPHSTGWGSIKGPVIKHSTIPHLIYTSIQEESYQTNKATPHSFQLL